MEKIEAEHVYIKDLFDDEKLFKIPDFQRPFAWEKENFEQLIDDIKDAIYVNKENSHEFNDYEPYFLGSLISLQYEEKGEYKYYVIDGQQRIVSLVILIAVIRDLIGDEKNQNELQGFIYQEPKEIIDQMEQSRVEIRYKERDFFREYILMKGGTVKRDEIDKNQFLLLTEPKQRMITAIDTFKEGFEKEDNTEFIKDYVKYLLKKVIMVVITTRSFDSAFRLFNVVNARGMPLTNADLLKSDNLSKVPDHEREKYTNTWENIEEEIGIEKMEMLISFIRIIIMKKKAIKTVYDDFQHIIFYKDPQFQGIKFIDYLDKVKDIYLNRIIESKINITIDIEKEVYYHNLMSIMRDFLPFNDWMAALIKFDEKFQNDDHLYEFVKNFERKIFIDWTVGKSFGIRLTQIYRVIRLIEDNNNVKDILNDPIFHKELKSQREKFNNSMDHANFYGKGRFQIAKYVLLRVEMERNENLHKKISFSGNITVEHILPRKPNKYWKNKFTEKATREWTNKLGNLTLLNGVKNSRASNKAFEEKIKTYFKKKSDFTITNELENTEDWNLVELKNRHTKIWSEARNIWIESA